MRVRTSLALVILLAATSCSFAGGPSQNPAAESWFEEHIRPVLISKCLKCHGDKKQEGNLRLDSLVAILKGGDSGPAITPGKPAESLLIEALRYESLEMPPDGQLRDRDIQRFSDWIAQNAPWPDHVQSIRAIDSSITAADRQWWAFQPLVKPNVPKHEPDNWSRNPIDRFVLRQLAKNDIRPAPQADTVTLIRRLFFDLIGLPPTPEQIDASVNDNSTDAWEETIDNLLDDERYGEHWARYWLDVVRYSESDGWNQDAYRPHMWRYRDYVVQSFNKDKPYPQFVREQLAGDEIGVDNPEHLAATGFLRLGIYEYNQRDARSHWNDIMNEMTDVTSDVFLGMGMACARCHDHKFDPLLQVDYYKLRAFFEPIVWRDDLSYATDAERESYDRQVAIWENATVEIRAEIDALLKPYYDRKWRSTVDKFPLDIQACFNKTVADRSSWEDQMAYMVGRQFHEEGGGPLANMKKEDKAKYEALKSELAKFDNIKPTPLPPLMVVTDFAGRHSPTVIPDDPNQASVQPGIPTVLTIDDSAFKTESTGRSQTSRRRTALSQWMGQDDNPLTTRVIVNRIWQQHFGQGIVPTANDFGHLGQAPSHPELLDWLTVTFVESGWSIKKLHKLILMSATWQQAAHHPHATEHQGKDLSDNLLWRARTSRLNAEEIRDAMLSVSGELKHAVGGPSDDVESPRRSLYVKSFRNTPSEFLHAFDIANGLKSVSVRDTTTTPTQSLLMINGPYVLTRAEKLAERLKNQEFDTLADRLTYAFQLTWGRRPTKAELANSIGFLGVTSKQPAGFNVNHEKLADLCHVLLNSNEFIYVD